MREGLRSQRRLGKSEKDQLSGARVVRKKADCIKQKAVDLDGKGLLHEVEALNLTIEKKGVQPVVVKEECELDWDMDTSSDAGLAKNRNKKRRLSCGNNIKEAKIEGNVNKEEGSIDVQICGRVLRPRFKRGDDKIPEYGENNGVLVEKSTQRDQFNEKKVKLENEEADEFVGNGHEKEMTEAKKVVNDQKELKQKHGRPLKVNMKEEDQLVGGFQRKCGRPPNAGRNNNLLKAPHNGKEKVGFQRGKKGLFMSDGANLSAVDDICSKGRSYGKEQFKRNRISPVKQNKFIKCLDRKSVV